MELGVLPAQPDQLGPLTLTQPTVTIGPLPGPPIGRHPVPQSALVDPQVPGHLGDRLPGLPHDPDRPSPELLIKLASRLGHCTASLLRGASRLRGETHNPLASR